MVVCKFGGSSVADENQIRKVRDILFSDDKRAVVVVSAPGKRNKEDKKITDMLYECNDKAKISGTCEKEFEGVSKRYLDIAKALNVDTTGLEKALAEVKSDIENGAGSDYTASRGEYLSGIIISAFLGWDFVDPKDYITINNNGTVNPDSYDKLAQRLQYGKKYVVPGFYGSDINGGIKTFSRGGSDITGAIVSRAIKASLYENWTDVSGMLSADPRIVENAKGVDELTYEQVRELSEFGASVFHEEAIAPVIPYKIPINIKNTNSPSDKGTFIVSSSNNDGLIGVSAKEGYSALSIRKLMLFKNKETRAALLNALSSLNIVPVQSLYGVDTVVYYFITNSNVGNVCEKLKEEFSLDEISLTDNYALLGLVGNMKSSLFTLKAAEALENANIEISFINHGSSAVTTSFGIAAEKAKEAVKVVYNAIF